MVKITIDITDEQDKQLRRMMIDKNATSKGRFIVEILGEWLEHMQSTKIQGTKIKIVSAEDVAHMANRQNNIDGTT